MKCPRCGRENPSTVRLCLYCGASLEYKAPAAPSNVQNHVHGKNCAHHSHAHTPIQKKSGSNKLIIWLIIAFVAVLLGTVIAALAFSGVFDKSTMSYGSGGSGGGGGGGGGYTPPPAINKQFMLYSNKNSVLIGEDKEIYIYLETPISAEAIELYDSSNPTEAVAVMYDDGDFDGHGDDMEGDGIYSAVLDVTVKDDIECIFYAVYNTQKSNELSIKYFTPFTDAELTIMDRVDKKIGKLISGSFFTKPIEERKALTESALNELASAGDIDASTVKYLEDHKMYGFRYSCGTIGAVMLEDFDKDFNGMASEPAVFNNVDTGTPTDVTVNNTGLFDDEEKEKYPLGDALILNAFPSFETEQQAISDRTVFYEDLEDEWEDKGLNTVLDTNVTVLDFLTLSNYNVVCISTHGAYDWNTGFLGLVKKSTAAICLSEKTSWLKNEVYSKYLKNDEIGKYNGHYVIMSKFFEEEYSANSFDDTFIFSECCMTFGYGEGSNSANYDYGMANAFTNNSAKAFIGFHNSVFADYSREFMKTYIDGLIDGQNSITAYNNAITAWGANHEVWFNNNNPVTLQFYIEHPDQCIANYDPKKHPAPRPYVPDVDIAYPIHRGDNNATLVSQLQNGNFTKYSFFTTTPKHWNHIGDVRTVKKLGDIQPVSSDGRMSIITTGIGASNTDVISKGTEGSLMSQTFILPQNAKKITFSYNFVSEEPMEYVGSLYNDSFAVDISCEQKKVFSNTYESINSSQWNEATGINFAGGDNTVYQTNWKTVEIDVSQYAGKIISLKFIVYDMGDSIYDSACLIDNVFVS